jgi:NAD(P)-dependent dehydrogenase (short-subunit alcohol dehydrogenase family)
MSTQKTIFITGASSGLGRASVKLFSCKGWRVIATMRGGDTPREGDFGKLSGVTVFPLDVTDPGQIKSAVAGALTLGTVDVVFNNAGYGMAGPLEGLGDEQIVRMVNTNLLGAIRITKAFVPHFRERRAGLFLTTTSIGGLIAVPFNSMYHATKWGLEGFCESMAFELKRFGIGMKTIEPGGMKTDFFTRSFDSGRHEAYSGLVERVMGAITDPSTMASYSTADQGGGRLRSCYRRQGPASLCRWRRCEGHLCGTHPSRRRSVPQGNGSAVFWLDNGLAKMSI